MNMSLVRFFIYLVCTYFFTTLGDIAELSAEKQALYYLMLLAAVVKIELKLVPHAEVLADLIREELRLRGFFAPLRQDDAGEQRVFWGQNFQN